MHKDKIFFNTATFAEKDMMIKTFIKCNSFLPITRRTYNSWSDCTHIIYAVFSKLNPYYLINDSLLPPNGYRLDRSREIHKELYKLVEELAIYARLPKN